MVRFLRRVLLLALLTAAVAAVARWWSARSVPQPSATPQWPPFEPPAPAAAPSGSTAPAASSIDDRHDDRHDDRSDASVQAFVASSADTIEVAVHPTWVLPVDGACPPGYPVKANDNSGIYHVPGGRSYERTKPERCYVDAESAAADGYRAAKA